MNSKAEVSDNIVLESVLNKCDTWIWIIDIQSGVVQESLNIQTKRHIAILA